MIYSGVSYGIMYNKYANYVCIEGVQSSFVNKANVLLRLCTRQKVEAEFIIFSYLGGVHKCRYGLPCVKLHLSSSRGQNAQNFAFRIFSYYAFSVFHYTPSLTSL